MKIRIATFVLSAIICSSASISRADTDVTEEKNSRTVVVTANRVETPIDQVASSMTVVPGKEIEERHLKHVSEALRDVPGVDVVRSGPVGGNTAVFIRGANSEHTLVLIDGIEANDPVSPTRAFNFSNLDTNNIQQIEVLRGPQSTLYGSDAMGGVINIITKKGDGGPQLFASADAGSYNTYTERAGFSGSTEEWNYSFGFNQENTQNISSAAFKYGNRETDGYRNTGFSSRVGFVPSDALQFNLITRYNYGESQLDNSGGVGADDPNRLLKNEQFFSRFEGKSSHFENVFQQTLGVSYSDQWIRDNNDVDDMSSDFLRSRYVGRLLKFDWQGNAAVTDWATVIVGAETEEERGSSNYFSDGFFGPFSNDFDARTARTNSYYAQVHFNADQFFGTTGVRTDNHSQFGTEVSWKAATGYNIESTKTRIAGSVGSGFKAPSLFQLYSSYGNPDLQPEKSVGVDGGIEQQILGDKLAVGVTYFWNKFRDLITFDPNTFISENIASARTQGLETSVSSRPLEDVSMKLSYTLLRTKDLDSDEQLLRRPKNRIGFDTAYQFSPKGNVILSVIMVGQRVDNDFSTFPATRTTLPTYTTLNLAANYELTERVELYARLDNIFDREYEDVLGFGTRGAAAYGGIKVKL